ncbi:MAG TPA: hypothetical protein VMK12_30725, partial [Anaeromyxobacteraceae bacterium]|nr:hypothetical protein [Anaeromyxobacteraceae bacterium]
MTDEHRGFLKHAGVPASVSARGLVGAASVSISRGNIYQPDEGGKVAFIVPARVYDPFTPEAPEPETVPQFGTLIDLIAVVPAVPRQWASRLGLAAWLGAIEPQLCRPAPVAI